MSYNFDAELNKEKVIEWIRNYFDENGKNSKSVIGISGGKDSSIVAKLCVEALGKDRVVGILMPDGAQKDIDMAKELCDLLDIKYYTINISATKNTMYEAFESGLDCMRKDLNSVITSNTPARIRMVYCYMSSAMVGGRVANTCNLSESYVGYETKYGDGAGDFSPLGNMTVQEVKAVGRALGLPAKFIDKVPEDGLCGKTDEDNLGFTYAVLDKYIRNPNCSDLDVLSVKDKIDTMHRNCQHKKMLIPTYNPYLTYTN